MVELGKVSLIGWYLNRLAPARRKVQAEGIINTLRKGAIVSEGI